MFPSHCVFLPGFMCDDRLFAPQINALDKAGIQSSVGDLTSGETIDRMAHHVLAHAPDVFALIGLSMGGILALRITDLAPTRVSHLALLNTTPFEDRVTAMRLEHLERLIQGDMEAILKDDMKPNYMFEENVTVDHLNLVLAMGRALGPDVFFRQTNALMHRRNQIHALDNIACPTLVLTGRHDHLCPPAIHQTMAEKIKDATLVILENCGHLSTLEKPKQVSQALLNLFTHSTGVDEPASAASAASGQYI